MIPYSLFLIASGVLLGFPFLLYGAIVSFPLLLRLGRRAYRKKPLDAQTPSRS